MMSKIERDLVRQLAGVVVDLAYQMRREPALKHMNAVLVNSTSILQGIGAELDKINKAEEEYEARVREAREANFKRMEL